MAPKEKRWQKLCKIWVKRRKFGVERIFTRPSVVQIWHQPIQSQKLTHTAKSSPNIRGTDPLCSTPSICSLWSTGCKVWALVRCHTAAPTQTQTSGTSSSGSGVPSPRSRSKSACRPWWLPVGWKVPSNNRPVNTLPVASRRFGCTSWVFRATSLSKMQCRTRTNSNWWTGTGRFSKLRKKWKISELFLDLS